MLNSKCTALADIAARGPRELLPGHGRSRLAQLAAGPSCKQPRTLVPARSIKSTPLSNLVGPRRGGAAGRQHPALRAFSTPTLMPRTPPRTSLASAPAPATAMVTHRRRVPGSPVNSGSRPEGRGDFMIYVTGSMPWAAFGVLWLWMYLGPH